MALYTKNLTEDLRLRLSTTDMDFLRDLSEKRCVSISEVIRSLIGEYRRSLEQLDLLSQALALAKEKKEKGEELSNGDTKTNFDNLV